MRQYAISPAAQEDIESILAWTHENFGEHARLRYKSVIFQALNDLAENPTRAGTQVRSEVDHQARTYHLRHSRRRVKDVAGTVKNPRHFILFRIQHDGTLEIVRIVHDRMDITTQLLADDG